MENRVYCTQCGAKVYAKKAWFLWVPFVKKTIKVCNNCYSSGYKELFIKQRPK